MSLRLLVLSSLFLLLFLHPGTLKTLAKKEEHFFKDCPPSRCGGGGGGGGLEIRYPLRLKSSHLFCGTKGLELSCSGNETLLTLPSSSSSSSSLYRVTAVDYIFGHLTINLGDSLPRCTLQNFSYLDRLSTPIYSPISTKNITLVRCSKKFTPNSSDDIAGPIPCHSSADYFVYVVDINMYMDELPSDCMVISTGGQIPDFLDVKYDPDYNSNSLGDLVEVFARIRWSVPGISDQCGDCESAGKQCGFNRARNQTFCRRHGLDVKLIAGTSFAGLTILASASVIIIFISRKSEKEKETRLKVERFLATYKSTNPTRYTYSEIKKITKRFSQKLGQGGFGSVYKGELPNGIPVAVKMLEKSKGEGEEFINEVATIGRIHHVNIVRLFGFSSEGTRHALIYEFMPNESLEKFIFSKEAKRTHQRLSMEMLQEIAIGIAQGIEYLHQGCDQRILHFDIKPHNILLDHNFNPKISDFGLAKLCSRDDSMVTMTAARGTMGYIAPEIYSRNFGTVSYKSDVYSFGMLLLEMVCGRKNADPAMESQSDVYFPEWVYDQLVHGEDPGLAMEKNEKEDDIVKKLVIVALWCIQWSPIDRPSMTRVVQLLMGNLESLQIPPKPFVSSSGQDNGTSINEV